MLVFIVILFFANMEEAIDVLIDGLSSRQQPINQFPLPWGKDPWSCGSNRKTTGLEEAVGQERRQERGLHAHCPQNLVARWRGGEAQPASVLTRAVRHCHGPRVAPLRAGGRARVFRDRTCTGVSRLDGRTGSYQTLTRRLVWALGRVSAAFRRTREGDWTKAISIF
jgi:hypothetical protein